VSVAKTPMRGPSIIDAERSEVSFAELGVGEQAELCLGALSAAAMQYFEAAKGRHFDEPRHGAEHYLQAKLFDAIAERQKLMGYVTLETSPKEVLSELAVADPSTPMSEAGIGSQRFDIVTGSVDHMTGLRSPEALIELKRDLADGLIAADVLKLLRFDMALKKSTSGRLKTAICLGLRRTSVLGLDFAEFERRVRSAVLGASPTAKLLAQSRTVDHGDHRLLVAGFFVDLR
jgi:hypothetical protein